MSDNLTYADGASINETSENFNYDNKELNNEEFDQLIYDDGASSSETSENSKPADNESEKENEEVDQLTYDDDEDENENFDELENAYDACKSEEFEELMYTNDTSNSEQFEMRPFDDNAHTNEHLYNPAHDIIEESDNLKNIDTEVMGINYNYPYETSFQTIYDFCLRTDPTICKTFCTITVMSCPCNFQRYNVKIISLPADNVCDLCRIIIDTVSTSNLDSTYKDELNNITPIGGTLHIELEEIPTLWDLAKNNTNLTQTNSSDEDEEEDENCDQQIISAEEEEEENEYCDQQIISAEEEEEDDKNCDQQIIPAKENEENFENCKPSTSDQNLLQSQCSNDAEDIKNFKSKYYPNIYLEEAFRAVLLMKTTPIVRICSLLRSKLVLKKCGGDSIIYGEIKYIDIIKNVYFGEPFIEIDGISYNCENTELVEKIIMMQLEKIDSRTECISFKNLLDIDAPIIKEEKEINIENMELVVQDNEKIEDRRRQIASRHGILANAIYYRSIGSLQMYKRKLMRQGYNFEQDEYGRTYNIHNYNF
ncbi:hypothetical protein M0804_005409 [Polistes exclamans]|nr:hypothetical protein M0804_005409 [Polistes exclamans]